MQAKRTYRNGLFLALFGMIGAPAIAESPVSDAPSSLPSRANAVWVYDPRKDEGDGRGRLQYGAYADAIADYNRRAGKKHRITMFYSMGGSLELYCAERGTPRQTCRQRDLVVTYTPQGEAHRSARAYQRIADAGEQRAIVTPIIDGLVNAEYEGSMKGFDQLSEREAQFLADKVAERVCADASANGVQFDVEPFNVEERHGQFHFYKRIASNFAGATGDFGCVDEHHPDGRVFSIFTTARRIRPDSESARNVAEILNTHGNGYLVGALYDLGAGPPGRQTPLDEYRRQVNAEVANMHQWAAKHGIHYQHGIPASAGYHEYQGCSGSECKTLDDGPTQLDYVKVALEAIRSQPETERFLGVTLWAWGPSRARNGTRFYPTEPPDEVLEYLSEHLGAR